MSSCRFCVANADADADADGNTGVPAGEHGDHRGAHVHATDIQASGGLHRRSCFLLGNMLRVSTSTLYLLVACSGERASFSRVNPALWVR